MTAHELPAGYSLGTRGKSFVFTCSRGMSGDFASAEVAVTAAHLDELFKGHREWMHREWLQVRLPSLAACAHRHGWRPGMTLEDLAEVLIKAAPDAHVRVSEVDEEPSASQRRLWDSIAAANAEHDA